VNLIFQGYSGGNVIFSDLSLNGGSAFGAGNLLQDPTVQISGSASPWIPYKGGYKYSSEDNTISDSSGSIQLSTPSGVTYDKAGDYGAVQIIEMKNYPGFSAGLTGIYFRGDAKIGGSGTVAGTYGAGFSLYVDIFYQDGSTSYGIQAQFQRNGTTGWQTAERYAYTLNKPVKSIQFVVLFRNSAGTAYFDNLYLTPLYCQFPFAPPTGSNSATYGDPHLVTLDGHPYDCQLFGDFILLQDPELTIVTRHSPAGRAAVNSMTGFIYNGTTFTFERNRDMAPPLFSVNGKPVDLGPGGFYSFPNGIGTITCSGSLAMPARSLRYDIDLTQTAHHIVMTANVGDYKVQWLQVYPTLPRSSINMTRGLLGVLNNDTSDDYTDSQGRVTPIDSDLLTVYKEFAWSWKLDQSPLVNRLSPDNDMVVSELPEKLVEISEFPQEQIRVAEIACTGISLFESCVLDVLLSNDPGYAHGYNSLEAILSGADASKPAKSSLDSSDESNSRTRTIILVVVFSVVGAMIILAIIVVVVVSQKNNKRSRRDTEDGLVR
jgi:hypothetical protein